MKSHEQGQSDIDQSMAHIQLEQGEMPGLGEARLLVR
jgi:hypothetical protein